MTTPLLSIILNLLLPAIALVIGTVFLWQAYLGTRDHKVAILGASGWGALALGSLADEFVAITMLAVAVLLLGVATLYDRRVAGRQKPELESL